MYRYRKHGCLQHLRTNIYKIFEKQDEIRVSIRSIRFYLHNNWSYYGYFPYVTIIIREKY